MATTLYNITTGGGLPRNHPAPPEPVAAGPGPVSEVLMGHTVLIVDDAAFMRVMLKDILAELGLEVVAEGEDGQEAVDLYRRLRPDLVLLDTTMPRLDGIAALREIVAEDPQAQVIMITALGQKEAVLASIKAGARDFVIKPFDQERVQDTVQRVLAAPV
jgi:two-component system chemotaxis response regulator CheY